MPRLIDANKACRIVEQLFCGVCRSYTHCDGCPYNNVLMLLRNLPTIDAEPARHGRWTNHLCEDGATDGIFCSQCDYETDRDSRPNYCPNCEAKMDEVEE